MYKLTKNGQIIFSGTPLECLERLLGINPEWSLMQARRRGYRIARRHHGSYR